MFNNFYLFNEKEAIFGIICSISCVCVWRYQYVFVRVFSFFLLLDECTWMNIYLLLNFVFLKYLSLHMVNGNVKNKNVITLSIKSKIVIFVYNSKYDELSWRFGHNSIVFWAFFGFQFEKPVLVHTILILTH